MASPNNEDMLEEELGKLSLDDEIIVYVENAELKCSRNVLIEQSRYFEALFNFDPDKTEVRLEGDMPEDIAKQIFEYFEKGQINLNDENIEDLLAGSIFLGCSSLEEIIVYQMVKTISAVSVFSYYHLSKSIGCQSLREKSEKYICKIFDIFLKMSTKDKNIEDFLSLDILSLSKVLQTDIQIDEKLILFCLLGWLEQSEDRKSETPNLLKFINFSLISEDIKNKLKEDSLFADEIQEVLKLSESQSRMIKRRMYHTNVPDRNKHGHRWPKLLVSLIQGKSGHKKLEYLDLSERIAQWRTLSKKIVSLDLLSGYSLIYSYPRIYFLGERKWNLHWYDIEKDSWDLWQGFSVSKLLAGSVSHKDSIYLIGGVNIEEWSSGSIELNTTSSVDIISPDNNRITSLPSLPQSVSNPSVILFNEYIYSFGGLQRRKSRKESFRLNLSESNCKWENIEPMPVHLCYPAICTDNVRNGIWIIGGMRIPSRNDVDTQEMRGETYFYNPWKNIWSEGPMLLVPRKSAFCYQINEDIYVTGGISEDLRPVSTTEVLRRNTESWEIVPGKWKNSCISNNTVLIHKPSRLNK